MAIKDILSNSKYADDMVLSLPDGTTFTLGDARQMNAQDRQRLTERAQQLEAAEAGVMSRVNSLRQAGLLDDQLNPVAVRQSDAQLRREITAQTGIDEGDPLFGPVLKQVKQEMAGVRDAFTKEVETLKSQLGAVTGATKQAIGSYLNDVYSSTYDRTVSTMPEDLRSKYSLKDAIAYANEHKFLDANGRLEIDRALDRMSWEDRKALELAKVRKDSEALNAQRKELASMQRPGVAGQNVGKNTTGFDPMTDKGRVKSIDEAIAAAASDDELWNSALRFTGTVQ